MARLNHFSRLRRRPVRYRHSIGSPSLSKVNPQVEELRENVYLITENSENKVVMLDKTEQELNDASFYFGEDEVVRFLDKKNDCQSDDEICSPVKPEKSLQEFFSDIKERYEKSEDRRSLKHLIVERDIERFWTVFFEQSINFAKHNVRIRFACESGADAGGLIREFLTLTMRNFALAPGLLFGSSSSVCFKATPEKVLESRYFTLGQLAGMAIVNIGRGPQCINEMVVKAMFKKPYGDKLPEIDDLNLKHCLENIDKKDYNCLYEHNIVPTGNLKECKYLFTINYVVLSNFVATEQFKQGLVTIDTAFLLDENYEYVRSFLIENNDELSLDAFLNLLCFKNYFEPGSNKYNQIRNRICGFEMVLASIYNLDYGISLRDVFFFYWYGKNTAIRITQKN